MRVSSCITLISHLEPALHSVASVIGGNARRSLRASFHCKQKPARPPNGHGSHRLRPHHRARPSPRTPAKPQVAGPVAPADPADYSAGIQKPGNQEVPK
jgi:hypothetical protein